MTLAVSVRSDEPDVEVSFEAERGEPLVLAGPNGAGKTTILDAVSGLRPGRVTLDGRPLDALPPERRGVGRVFQDRLLFPHLSVLDNVAFGTKPPSRDKARHWLSATGAGGLAGRRPASLSGGEAAAVALARALATEPQVLLLDEPLAALDATAKARMRHLLAETMRGFGGIAIIVTHDPVEALSLGRRVVVVEQGRVTHDGSTTDLKSRPRTRYVADLLGINLFQGVAAGGVIALDGGGEVHAAGAPDGRVIAVAHPSAVAIYRSRPDGSPRNVIESTVVEIADDGDRARVRLDGTPPLLAAVTHASAQSLRPGDRVWASVKATEISAEPD